MTTLVGGIAGSLHRERWTRILPPVEARLGVVAIPHGAGIALRLALP